MNLVEPFQSVCSYLRLYTPIQVGTVPPCASHVITVTLTAHTAGSFVTVGGACLELSTCAEAEDGLSSNCLGFFCMS